MRECDETMEKRKRSCRRSTVILANGEFPKRGGAGWKLLADAAQVVCCDGAAAAYRRRFGRWPTAVVGDLDSLGRAADVAARDGAVVVRIADQETNDLEKAIGYCASRGWRSPVIVGATGKREDHTLGNVFRALERGLEIVTDCGRFVPVCGRRTLHLAKGAGVSVFAPDSRTRMTSKGLQWPLDGVRFRNLYCATLNRATAKAVVLTSTHPVYAYIET